MEAATHPRSLAPPAALSRFWVALAAVAVVGPASRLALIGLPVSTDEGGFAEVARLWARGGSLYRDVWVDRPQLLLLVFRLVDGSVVAMRLAAAIAAAALVVAAALVARELFDERAALVTAALVSLFGLSPFIEAFTLNGELLAAVPATISMWVFARWSQGRADWMLVLAGALSGMALLTKQSAFDALAAAVVYALWEQPRRLRAPMLLVAGALLPVAIAASTAPSIGEWWRAVVVNRTQQDSLVTGSLVERLSLFLFSLQPATVALALVIVLAVIGRRRVPSLVRLWILFACLGVLGGGNFYTHYYIQLVAPLGVAAACGYARLMTFDRREKRLFAAPLAALAVVALIVTAKLYTEPRAEQTRAVFFRNPHLVTDATLARFVRSNTSAEDTVLILTPSAPDVYWLADRTPAIPYIWQGHVASVPGALAKAVRAVRRGEPRLVVIGAATSVGQATGGRYRLATKIGPNAVLRRNAST